ncbi:MAG: biopolymer transporter ExbD [Pseudomonadota bacterium]
MQRPSHLARPRKPNRDDDRVLPLINIVFLLLIFFMVVGRLSASDPFEIVPPRSISQGPPPAEEILVSIGPAGELALNGEIMERADVLSAIGTATSEVRIKSDGRVDATFVVGLIETLRRQGVASVRLMTVPRREVE